MMQHDSGARVVIVNGSGGVGKDTFCDMCGKYTAIAVYSSVSYIKDVARQLGWSGKKDEESRRFLSDLKDLTTAYNDLPMQKMREAIETMQSLFQVVFLMIREPSEIQRAKEAFGATTLLIKRPTVESITSNHADANVDDYDYDYTIINSDSLSELEQQAEEFSRRLLEGFFDGDDT